MKARLALAAAAVAVLGLVAPSAAAARPATGVAVTDDAPGSLLSGEIDAYAYRVEYDLPLPAGSTIAHITANAQRSASVEASHGFTASPTDLGAVVGGKYADPRGTGHPENVLPQVECTFPSSTPTNVFRWPTATRDETSGVPATSYAYASCGDGPSVTVKAHAADPADPAAAAADPKADETALSASDALITPDKGLLVARATSSATGLSFAGGLIRIGSVTATGLSATAGTPGSAVSSAAVSIGDIDVGGSPFSLTFAGQKVSVTVGGTTVPLTDPAGQQVIAAANAVTRGVGCSLTIVSSPEAYPQGFLFSRPQPPLGVEADGSLAASYEGGLLIVCDVPDNPVADATQFNPERFQALVGFVYTSVQAKGDVGGFGIGDLGGAGLGGATSGPGGPADAAVAAPAPAAVTPVATPIAAAAPKAAPAPPATSDTGPTVLTSFLEPLPTGVRWGLGIAFVLLWAGLTHLGVTRLLVIGPRAGRGAR